MAKEKLTYLQAFQELQTICERIKAESIPIEDLPAVIKQARKLVAYCEELLQGIETELNDQKES